MTFLTAFARHLHGLGLVVFDETGVTGDCFIDTLPSQPDEAVGLFGYGGPESNAGGPWDSPRMQVRVRGTQDPRVSRGRCQDIYDALHGLGPADVDGLWVANVYGLQSSPQSLGRDDNNRNEHVVNLQLEVRNPARAAV